jgi:hypothetical protein
MAVLGGGQSRRPGRRIAIASVRATEKNPMNVPS